MKIPTKRGIRVKGWLYSIVAFSFFFVLPLNADPVEPPNPDVEAATARALLENGIKLHNMVHSKDTNSNLAINGLPYALSRLGRTKAALKITYWKQIDSPKSERDEVLRISVRRSAILGDIARAAGLVPKIKNRYCKVDALLTLARGYIRKNDLASAQKVLFKVTPVVSDNFDVFIHTASLFSRCGDKNSSRRVFRKAEDMYYQSVQNALKKDNSNDPDIDPVYYIRRSWLDFNMLKSGLPTEWEQFYKRLPADFIWLSTGTLQLLPPAQIDVVVDRLHKKDNPAWTIRGLFRISEAISPKHPEKALSVLERVEKIYHKYSKDGNDNSHQLSAFTLSSHLASGYHYLGDETDAQKWLAREWEEYPTFKKKAEKLLPKGITISKRSLELAYAISPITIEDDVRQRCTFSKESLISILTPERLLNINAEVQKYLPRDNKSTFHYAGDLRALVKDEIAAGQKPQAFANIKYLEKCLERKVDTKDPFITSDLIGIAKLWRKLGDQEELDAFLKDFFNYKQNDYPPAKQDNMNVLVANGFVSEVEKVFNSFPQSERDSMKSFSVDIKYQIAISNVNKLPSDVLINHDPAMTVSRLITYVNKLTKQVFDVPSEKQFEINSGGFVIRQGYATNQNIG